MINESSLLTPENCECVVRSLPMPGARILDVSAVRASYGHLLVLRSNGEICGVNLDSGVITRLCLVELPELPSEEGHGYFGAAAWRLHSNICGTYCAIVVDQGRKGIVVDTLSGGITMALDGGDYYEETVPFSACFLRFADKDVFVYRSAWNRLDAADPATGKSLTDRHIAPYEEAGPRPAHYLDYFHGRLWPSPDGSLILDDGWVWHPVSVPRVWSATDWLSVNPWESEDGASVVDLVLRDDWNTPTCWIGEHHVAMWGLVDSENPEGSGKRPGVHRAPFEDCDLAQFFGPRIRCGSRNACWIWRDNRGRTIASFAGVKVDWKIKCISGQQPFLPAWLSWLVAHMRRVSSIKPRPPWRR